LSGLTWNYILPISASHIAEMMDAYQHIQLLVVNYLPGLALTCNLPHLSLPGSEADRCEPPHPAKNLFNDIHVGKIYREHKKAATTQK
jgi:hypothetical protein